MRSGFRTRTGPGLLAVSLLFLLGTVEEQRARLPPAKEGCSGEIAGTWVSYAHYPQVGYWYRFTMDIGVPASDGSVRGTIRADYWLGDADESATPTCTENPTRQGVVQEAAGTYLDGRLEFAGIKYETDPDHPCATWTGYSVDAVAGHVDHERNEIQARMDDEQPHWTNIPTVFRRVDCLDPRAPSRVINPLDPPPKKRPRSWLGCW